MYEIVPDLISKTENEWYRNEIEICQRDTAEYISYLQSKKLEKVTAIEDLIASNEQDLQSFIARRQEQEDLNNKKIQGQCIDTDLRAQIEELEVKLQAKESEIALLSDTMVNALTRRVVPSTSMK